MEQTRPSRLPAYIYFGLLAAALVFEIFFIAMEPETGGPGFISDSGAIVMILLWGIISGAFGFITGKITIDLFRKMRVAMAQGRIVDVLMYLIGSLIFLLITFAAVVSAFVPGGTIMLLGWFGA